MPPINPLKVLNLAPFGNPRTARLTLSQRLQGALKYGFRWFREYPAQERLAELLAEHLDRRFLLVLNLMWPNMRAPFPPILLGPSGIHLLLPTLIRGDYRVREDRLWIYDTRKQRFKPYRPDLVQEALEHRHRLQNFLQSRLEVPVTVETRVVFLHPGTYVDAFQAHIAPLMVDGLARYLEQLSRQRKYQRGQIHRWLEVLQEGPSAAEAEAHEAPRPRREARATPPRRGRTAPASARPARRPRRSTATRARGPLGFTRQQWLILAALLGLNLLLFVAFLVFILLSS